MSKSRKGEPRYKHGMDGTRLYKCWIGLKARCNNPNDKDYKNYGGRGILVCEEWLNDFVSFMNWSMLSGYTDDLTIDRIDNNKGYSPDNCRFVTVTVNNRNRRNVKLDWEKVNTIRSLYNSGKHTQTYISELFNISPRHLRSITSNQAWRK